jgi:Ca-activated chloride channel family protein
LSFARPELLALAAVAPAAAMVAWLLFRRRRRAENAWVGALLEPRMRVGGAPRAAWVAPLLLALAVLGVALALARPRWGTSRRTVERRGLDVVFVVDTSLSMEAFDVAPSRFWLAETLVRRLAQELPGNRVALVAAEGEGQVMAPLTLDAEVLDLVLDSLEPGTLAIPGTRLTDAIEQALKLFPAESETHRAIVLLSDGEDHGGHLERAAEELRRAGVVVAAIGIGTPRGGPIPLADGGYKRDQGEIVITRLHPEVLKQLAGATGGVYVEAHDARFEPGAVVNRLSSISGRELEQTSVQELEERFQWPLALAALALALSLLLTPWRWRPAAGEGV